MRTTIRLDKLLANMGFGTRTEIKRLVKSGAVLVADRPVTDSAIHVDPQQQQIYVHGHKVIFKPYIYLVMNKPPGVISATEDTRDRTVIDLLGEDIRHYAVFPVGRLDKDTEGLLLLTNDGKLSHQLLSPRRHVPKTYLADVEGIVDERDIAAFAAGVELDDGYRTMSAQLNIVETPAEEHDGRKTSRIQLTIVEGKFHQVKRMFQAVGKRVVYLQRIAMGPLRLEDDLLPGQYRELAEEEVARLKQYADDPAR